MEVFGGVGREVRPAIGRARPDRGTARQWLRLGPRRDHRAGRLRLLICFHGASMTF